MYKENLPYKLRFSNRKLLHKNIKNKYEYLFRGLLHLSLLEYSWISQYLMKSANPTVHKRIIPFTLLNAHCPSTLSICDWLSSLYRLRKRVIIWVALHISEGVQESTFAVLDKITWQMIFYDIISIVKLKRKCILLY